MNHLPSEQFNRNLISRDVTVDADSVVLIMSLDVPQHERWQFIFKSTGGTSGVGELKFIYKSRIAQFASYISFGKNNGDIITGQGSVEIYLKTMSVGSTQISCYMSNQSFDIDVGSLVQHKVLTDIAVYYHVGGNNGFIEYPFNRYAIFTTHNINLKMTDESGNTEATIATVTPLEAQVIKPIPLNYRLSIQGTQAAQNLSLMYLRQD